MAQVTVSRIAHFNAAHRLHVPAWSDEQNREVFGLCNNPSFHGHNYELHVQLCGEPDPVTGYVYDLKHLKDLVEAEVIQRYDHRNLNLDTEDFRNTNPTAENIAIAIWNRLRPHLASTLELHIRLYETPRNYVEYRG